MKQPEPFLPEEIKTLLRAVIDLTMTADLSKVPQSSFAVEARKQLQADMRSKEPLTPEEARMRAARIEVANLLACVVGGHPLPDIECGATAKKLLDHFAVRLR
jgi:hypothetical protein